MGCVFSRPEFDRPNPRIFQVWNVDSEGRNVKPGRIEVTESQLILYQRGDITVRWPLRSLRRYGFDAELFSFECGRRCPTGPGVYAFKCRRAEALFNLLQECIQNSGGGPGNISIAAIDDQVNLATPATTAPAPAPAPSMNTNGTLANSGARNRLVPGVDSAGYLEPITGGNSHPPVQCPQTLTTNSPRSFQGVSADQHSSSAGGFVCIHSAGAPDGSTSVEWSSGFPPSLPVCCSFGSCSRTSHNYVNEAAEHMVSNNGCPSGVCVVHQYMNSAVLDHSHRCCCPSSRCCDQSGNAYVNSAVTSSCTTIHPGGFHCAMNCVDFNTNYAKLDDLLKQEQSVKRHKEEHHFYVNVKPEHQPAASATSSKCMSGRSTPTDCQSRNGTSVISPTGSLLYKSHSSHFYANLGSLPAGDLAADVIRESRNSPQVNYAVLDLDQNFEAAAGGGASVSIIVPQASTSSTMPPSTAAPPIPSSPPRTPEGYAQIDFDRTAALSNSANPCPFNDESIRKTRHNAVIPSTSTPS